MSKAPGIFKNQQLNEQFDRDGYVHLPFLRPDEVAELNDTFDKHFRKNIEGLYASINANTQELNNLISDTIKRVFSRACEELFVNYRIILGHYMVKSPVNTWDFHLHQDWTIVDESKDISANMWCPMEDTSSANGGMYLIPGSHKLFNSLRSGSLGLTWVRTKERIAEYVVPINVKAGEILIYRHSLFHGSYPNNSDRLRVTAMSTVLNEEADLLYYQKDASPDRVEVCHISPDILLSELHHLEKGIAPTGKKVVNSVDYDWSLNSRVDEELVLKRIKQREGHAERI
jgi:hypothetical protein